MGARCGLSNPNSGRRYAVLSLSTLEAVRRWRFEPATLDGFPVKALYSLTVNYAVPVCTNLFA
jgi:hypothetical protein